MFTIDELDHAAEIVHRVLEPTPQIRSRVVQSGCNIDRDRFAKILA